MPTAFSPYSSQGLNDEVKPMFVDDWGKLCGVKTGTWSVYNRWGECVFDKRPVTEAWNGLYMDEPVMTGMYVYIVNVTFDETVSGFRNMIRQGTILVVDAKK
jgi:gliding motility-associated-like protein